MDGLTEQVRKFENYEIELKWIERIFKELELLTKEYIDNMSVFDGCLQQILFP